MLENLQAAYGRNGKLTVIEVAFEVAFSGESWPEVCLQAEQVSGCEPGLYKRLQGRLERGQTMNSLIEDAFEDVICSEGVKHVDD